ncbi:MAG: hypothetical protein ACQCN6_14045 [Candidatus Bathyarchaeia archaeon]|jgi:hypothetical protein
MVTYSIIKIRLFTGFSIRMLLHTHTVAPSAWKHVERVAENALPTPKQALKNIAKTESNNPSPTILWHTEERHIHIKKKDLAHS